jgi:hypothetical protein
MPTQQELATLGDITEAILSLDTEMERRIFTIPPPPDGYGFRKRRKFKCHPDRHEMKRKNRKKNRVAGKSRRNNRSK